MRILHVIPGLKNASGPTHSVYYLSKHMAEAGHEVAVAYVSGRGTDPEFPFSEKVKLMGFPCKFSKKWAYSPALQNHLNRNIEEYDIVHVHGIWLFPNFAVWRAAKNKKVPYIIRTAGYLEPWCLESKGLKKNLYLSLIERRVINDAVSIQATAEQEKRNLQKLAFEAPIFTISNGIELSDFRCSKSKSELKDAYKLPKDKFILLFLSRIHPKKNLEFLGRVVKKLVDQGQELFLVVAGPKDHAYAKQIQEYYQEIGLSDHSRFVGEVSREDKVELYHAADAFALTTYSENFGFVVLEALASGLPVLVSDQTPWSELNSRKAGYWLPLDEKKFEDGIGELISNEQLLIEMGENALTLAREYAWKTISQRLIEQYKKLSGQKVNV